VPENNVAHRGKKERRKEGRKEGRKGF